MDADLHGAHAKPARPVSASGARRFAAFQLLIGGIIVSSLFHPIFFGILAAQVITGTLLLGLGTWFTTSLLVIGAFNLVVGYASGFGLGLAALRHRAMPLLKAELAWLPLYWLMISLAAYRALGQFVTRPFYWEKTSHGLDQSASPLPRLQSPPAGSVERVDLEGAFY